MKGVLPCQTKEKSQEKKQNALARSVPPFPVEFRVKIARLHVEDGYPVLLIAQQFKISEYSVYRWGKNKIDPSTWRIAARKWMEKHRLIVITKPAKVLHNFFEKKAIISDGNEYCFGAAVIESVYLMVGRNPKVSSRSSYTSPIFQLLF